MENFAWKNINFIFKAFPVPMLQTTIAYISDTKCFPGKLIIYQKKYWSGRRGSNPRPPAWKAGTLPLSYSRLSGQFMKIHSLSHSLNLQGSIYIYYNIIKFA